MLGKMKNGSNNFWMGMFLITSGYNTVCKLHNYQFKNWTFLQNMSDLNLNV